MNNLRAFAFALALLLVMTPLAVAEDSDGDGYDNPSETFTIWDGADAYPNNPDIHEAVFSTGCDPPVAKLDWVNLSRLRAPSAMRDLSQSKSMLKWKKVNISPIVISLGHTTLIQKNELN